jgi:hypothetical protein
LRGAIALAPTGWAWTREALNAGGNAGGASSGVGDTPVARRPHGNTVGDPRTLAQRLDAAIAAVRTADRLQPAIRTVGLSRARTRFALPLQQPGAASR